MVFKKKILDKNVFVVTFMATLVVHGEMIFNKLSWHDDVGSAFYGWGDGLRHGRWLYALMESFLMRYSGAENLPVVHACISAICIGVVACILFKLFEINNKVLKIALVLVFVSLPAVTGLFGYMVSAGYNFIGILLCVCGAYIINKGIKDKRDWKTFLLSSLLLACSIGVYQCNLTLYLTLILLYFTYDVIRNQLQWKTFFSKASYLLSSAIVGLGSYLVILKILLRITNTELTNYAGMDSFGIVSISEYLERFMLTYKEFLFPDITKAYNMFPFHWKGWYLLLLVLLVVLVMRVIILKIFERDVRGVIQFVFTVLLLPCALNFNFILYSADNVHSLHMYHYILLFVYFYILLTQRDNIKWHYVIITVVFMFGALYVRYDNSCYMLAEFRQEAAIRYFSTLITRIESTEGYKDEYPIAFINEFQKANSIDYVTTYYDYPITNPYAAAIVNSYNWKAFMSKWCGYYPTYADVSAYNNNPIVEDMATYPDDASIRIIDGVIVVKF